MASSALVRQLVGIDARRATRANHASRASTVRMGVVTRASVRGNEGARERQGMTRGRRGEDADASSGTSRQSTIKSTASEAQRRGVVVRSIGASTYDGSELTKVELRQKLSVFCVMLAVFLHLLGFTVTGPITPGLVSHFSLAAENVGYLTSAYPLGMFGALFLWPRLSDKVGRKPILVLSLMGVGVGLILQGLCVKSGWSLQTFLLLRVLSGAFAGASPVVKAYLADAATPEFLPQLMAWREASCTLAFIVGPTLGGLLFAGYNLSAAISVTGWASIAAAALVAVFMTSPAMMRQSMAETLEAAKAEASDEAGASATKPAKPAPGVYDPDALSCPLGREYLPAVATICFTSFLYNAGQSTFDSFFPLLLSKKLEMSPTQIGALLTTLSVVSFTVSATLFAPVQKLLGLTKTTVIGLLCVAIGLVAIGQANVAAFVPPAAIVYVAGLPLFTPAIPILLMQCVPPTKRGAVMGIDSAINSMARILSPLVFGRIFATDPALCFGMAGAIVFVASVVVMARRFIVRKSVPII
mmetsp:Transcript_4327/g.15862  ORF Transcript_4327/g.15862 Transcript_4327/m.15862 type:complete len:529 (-) Transcript_4327:100-1686(-)